MTTMFFRCFIHDWLSSTADCPECVNERVRDSTMTYNVTLTPRKSTDDWKSKYDELNAKYESSRKHERWALDQVFRLMTERNNEQHRADTYMEFLYKIRLAHNDNDPGKIDDLFRELQQQYEI